MNAEEILEQMDGQMGVGIMPIFDMLPEYYSIADARMSVFRSDRYWVLIFEFVSFQAKACEFETSVWAYGNCLREYSIGDETNEGQGWLHHFSHTPFGSVPDEPLWRIVERDGDEYEMFLARKDGFSILLSGKRLDFAPTENDYKAADIDFENDETNWGGPEYLTENQLLRFLCHHLNHPFFASEDHLRHIIEVCHSREEFYEENGWRATALRHELQLLLQTRDWRHPTFMPGAEDDNAYDYEENLPSQVECFQILAKAIETGDLAGWNAQNPETFNSNWQFYERKKQQEKFDVTAALEEQWRQWEAAMSKLPVAQREQIEKSFLEEFGAQSPIFYPGMTALFSASIEIEGKTIVVPQDFWQRHQENQNHES